jgi:hypothetical protein
MFVRPSSQQRTAHRTTASQATATMPERFPPLRPSVPVAASNLSGTPKEEQMRKLIAIIATALALAGVGLATHTTSDAPDEAAVAYFPRKPTLQLLMRSARL